jgi:hypothetical protein
MKDPGADSEYKGRMIMTTHNRRNSVLALFGLLALSVYILACTSFSPDDSKVLYPSFDPVSGVIGMAAYDREAQASQMLFLPVAYDSKESNTVPVSSMLRAGWLANGREIVVACTSGKDSSDTGGLSLSLIPWGAGHPVKVFRVPELNEAAQFFMVPLCVASDCVFLSTSRTGIARLNLRTGALTGYEFDDAKGEVALYPTPDGNGVFYFETGVQPNQRIEFGRLGPKDFSRKPLMVWNNDLGGGSPRINDRSVVAYDRAGKVLAFLGSGDQNELLVLRKGQAPFTRSLDTQGQKRYFGSAVLAPSGKSLYASFQQTKDTNSVSYGLMEIPLSDAPTRELILIHDAPPDDESCVYYFQAAVSHDGRTAAVASTYLACSEKPFKASDCALFLVDLSQPAWKVTKIPIPMPVRKPSLMK